MAFCRLPLEERVTTSPQLVSISLKRWRMSCSSDRSAVWVHIWRCKTEHTFYCSTRGSYQPFWWIWFLLLTSKVSATCLLISVALWIVPPSRFEPTKRASNTYVLQNIEFTADPCNFFMNPWRDGNHRLQPSRHHRLTHCIVCNVVSSCRSMTQLDFNNQVKYFH